MKICPNCSYEFRKDRERIRCGHCLKVFDTKTWYQRCRKYITAHPEKTAVYQQKFRLENPEYQRNASQKYRDTRTPEKKKKYALWRHLYYLKNKDHSMEMARLRMHKKLQSNEVFRIHNNISRQLRRVLKQQGKTKSRTLKMYGINAQKIVDVLGQRPGTEYQLDHIRPITSYDLNDPEQVKIAYSPENLQWLKGTENIRKSNIWIDDNGITRKGTEVLL
jgi:hypothetical protein